MKCALDMPQINKERQLLAWCRMKKVFSSVDVKQYGNENYYTSADVRVREFVRLGLVERYTSQEAILLGYVKKGQASIAWYKAKDVDQN